MTAVRPLLAAALAPQAHAVEGGIGAYFLGTRDSLAGVVPPPDTYLSFTYDHLRGDVSGVSIGGLPINADAELESGLFAAVKSQPPRKSKRPTLFSHVLLTS